MASGAFSRRTFLGGAGLVALGSAPPSFAGLAARRAVLPDRVVQTACGNLQGVATDTPGVTKWLGIRYAEPPTGSLRWRPPVPAQPWRGTRFANRFSASPWAMPPDKNSVYDRPVAEMDEDCLSLNVWAPLPSARPKPVLVWIYGGAFVGGTSDHPLYDGEQLAGQDVVFVSINYRVGILGFFAHPELSRESADGISGNYGLMDQIAALRWVRENIAAFGGDPHNVTILGQSAGAFSVGFHLAMPSSRGLFHRAIAQSGAPMGKPSSFILLGERAGMEAAGIDFAAKVGAKGVADLRQMPPRRLVEANSTSWRFYPQIDGHLIPAHPFDLIQSGRHAAVPVIVGRNRDEGTMFPPLGNGTVAGLQAELDAVYGEQAPEARKIFAADDEAQARQQGQRAFGDIVFNWNAAALAAALAQARISSVYSYQFDYTGAVPPQAKFAEGSGRELGAFHGAEIGFALRTQAARGFPMGPDQTRLANMMSGWWLNFARHGTPNSMVSTAWPKYRLRQPTVFHIDAAGGRPGPLDDRERLQILGRAMGNRIIEHA